MKILLKPIRNLFKRAKSANTSTSQLNSGYISASSALSTHDLRPGSNTETAEPTTSGGFGTFKALHKDPIAPLRTSSIPDLPSSVVGVEHGRKPTVTLTSCAEPASMDMDWTATAKEHLGVSLRFGQTLLKKLPDCVDTNPVKAVFAIAKAIIEIKNAVGDNRDELVRRIEQTANRLLDVERIIMIDIPEAVKQEMEKLKRVLEGEIKNLKDLARKSLVLQTLDCEEEKKLILQIFQRVDDATMSFRFELANSIQMTVNAIHGDTKKVALERLCPSEKADYKTFIEDDVLKREECTAGTRIDILDKIADWVNDDSLDAPRVFWLTGQAGSGKTTITYTIAKRFEKDDNTNQHTVLGGTFLCSRQFEETRGKTRILPTIAYQLARKCKYYADALYFTDKFEAVKHDVSTQLEDLLGPWQLSEATRSPELPGYLIVIDALDEIKDKGGSAFLHDLLTFINKIDLRGLKFLVTSRSNPEIVQLCKSFTSKAVCRLQDVPINEAESDIMTYLKAKLPLLASKPELAMLIQHSGGLFIYAATAVRYLTLPGSVTIEEQIEMLNDLLSKSYEQVSANDATYLIDQLYRQIMLEAFSKLKGKFLTRRLHILYTFLCTIERTSPSIIAGLILGSNIEAVNAVLHDLHAVLYTKEGRVFWYHASFPDFIFDRDRSDFLIANEHLTFWCDEAAHHKLLAESCFRVMKSCLRFNMGNIPSSFLMDNENSAELSEQINQNITGVLRYSCCHWAHHLPSPQLIHTNDICCCISDFLQIHVLFWIETLNLLKLRKDCTAILQRARLWVLECGNDYKELTRDVGEAAKFATYYTGSPAAESTPHLYISALATWSQETKLCRHWKKQFPYIPIYTQTVSGRLPLMTIQTTDVTKSVAFSGDGAWIVSGLHDNSVRIWDVSTGTQLEVLNGHTSWVSSVAFLGDGTRIVSGSHDNSVRVWDVSMGTQLEVLSGHTNTVSSVALSSDGARIVSGSEDKSVRVWDALMGTQLRVLNGHTNTVSSVAFSSDGARVVSGSYDKSVRMWDVLMGTQLDVLNGHTDWVSSVAFSSDGEQIVSGSYDGSVRMWDVLTGTQLEVLNGHTNWVKSVAFSSDGARIVSGSFDNSVRIWDVSTGIQLEVLNGHTNWVNSVAFSRDGARIVSGSFDKSVCVWDASTGTQLEVLNGHTSQVNSVAFSSDGTCIVSGSDDQSVCVWDASTGTQLEVLNGHTSQVSSVSISSDSARIVSGSFDNCVRVWDVSTGTQLEVLNGHASQVNSIAFSSDGAQIASGLYDGSVCVWDTSTGTQLGVLNVHTSQVSSVAFSSDSVQIVSGSHDQSVCVWDMSTGTQLEVFNGHTSQVTSVAFSSDGTQVISGSRDKSVRVWDVPTGTQLDVLHGHTSWVTSVAFSSDSAWIVSGSFDKSVRIWDVSTGTQLEVLNGHTHWVTSVAFSSDGAQIVSGSYDESVRVWDTPTHQELIGFNNILTTSHEHLHWVWGSKNWIVSSRSGNHLMWVPVAQVLFPFNRLLISQSGFATIDFNQSMIGTDWARCYSPQHN